jgi:hypothetical protein
MVPVSIGPSACPCLVRAAHDLARIVSEHLADQVEIGDLLVASSAPGRAKRAPADPAVGTVIGKALEPFEGARGTITMLVMSR